MQPSNTYLWIDRVLKLIAALGAVVMSWQLNNNNTQNERHHQERMMYYRTGQAPR